MVRHTNKQILILGGTGAMGTYLVQMYKDKPDVDCFVTSRKHLSDFSNIHYVHGNAIDDTFLFNLLKQKDWDAIIDFMSYSTEQFQKRVNDLLNATHHYIFLSSARVYADSENPIREDSPRLLDVCTDNEYLGTDEYALAKARQEDLLQNSAKKNWTIVRPYITFSEYRLQLGVLEKEQWLYRAQKGKSIIFSKDIASKYTTMTHGKDVAKGIYALIGRKEAMGEIFQITAPNPIKWEEVLTLYTETIKKVTGKKTNVIFTDHHEMIVGGGTIYQWKYDRLFNRRFDNTKISRFIEQQEITDPKITLEVALEKFINSPKWLEHNIYDMNREIEIGLRTGEYPSLCKQKNIRCFLKLACARLHILNFIRKIRHHFD